MSETYAKLFGSITRSSIWLEDDQTLRVWVTMLAIADRNGYVGASVGGLAATARVPREKVEEALAKFLGPDPDSRSQEYEGRRIEVADRGWNLLNYERFRDMRDEEARKEYERNRKREARAAKRARKLAAVPDSPGLSRTVPACPEMSAVSAPHRHKHLSSEAEEEKNAAAPPQLSLPSPSPSASDSNSKSDVVLVFEHWAAVMGKPKAKPTGQRVAKVRARLAEGYTVADLKAAVDGCKRSEWHMGANENGQPYNDLEQICRGSRQVDQHIERAGGARRAAAASPIPKSHRMLA